MSDVGLEVVVAEKRMALIKAWEENEKTKADNRYLLSIYVCLYTTRTYVITCVCVGRTQKSQKSEHGKILKKQ